MLGGSCGIHALLASCLTLLHCRPSPTSVATRRSTICVMPDVRALAAEAEVLSAHYSIDTSHRHPRRRLNGTTAASDVPTLSPALLAFLEARHVASQTHLLLRSCRRTDLALGAQDVVALANKPVVNVPKVRDDLPLKRYFISYVHPLHMSTWLTSPP